MTGQPGNISEDRDAAADAEDIESGQPDSSNWQRAADNVHQAQGRDRGTGSAGRPAATRGAGSARGAGRETRDPRESRQPRSPISDLSGEIQRWFVRSSARSMRRELGDQVSRAFGGKTAAEPSDVWGAATAEPPPEPLAEAPECAWCPVCRAARQIRKSGPGLGGQLAGAGDAVAAAVQEALAAFDAALSERTRAQPADRFPAERYPSDRFPADQFPVAGAADEADHDPDDRS